MLSTSVNWAKTDLLVLALAHAMVLTKMTPFLHLPIAKGGTRSIAHLPVAEGLSFQSLDCKLRKKKRFNQVCSEFSSTTSKSVA